ncbi:flap structure-specific endonuclease [Candidatus Woesearchaeota archaeon]|nr:flap structure-specific endonuclease [Candidatus Woesearchaeota archaeon]
MGLSIGPLLVRDQISLASLKGKRIAVDTYIELYQFLRSMPVLTDRKGRVTTHLSGLFYRTTHLLSLGVKPCFVLDGPFPDITKHAKVDNRSVAPRTGSTITPDIMGSTKTLLQLLGVPVIQSPSEGEAQAAHLARKGQVWGVASQDFDSLLFGAPRFVFNLTMAKTRKVRGRTELIGTYVYDLQKNLKHLGISREQFIGMAMLVGTDFNPGVEGLGPKRALELVKRYKHRLDKLFKFVPWRYQYTWKEVYDCIRTMPVTNRYRLKWKAPDVEGLVDFLVKQHDFDEKRVRNALQKTS